uniref:C2H2-type domain-containing protein n=1 Tax=Panagrellus redivivus TaxID=6233 RepID=A0A7E4W0I4_PANRE
MFGAASAAPVNAFQALLMASNHANAVPVSPEPVPSQGSPDFVTSLLKELSKQQQQSQQVSVNPFFPVVMPNLFGGFDIQAQMETIRNMLYQQELMRLLSESASVSAAKLTSPVPSREAITPENGSRKRPVSSSSSMQSEGASTSAPVAKRSKQVRKLLSDDAETNSPVSGMHIKELSEITADELAKASELDPSAPLVNITEESRQKIAEIPNVIGDSICSLCKVKFDDVFRLAMHKCPRIVHEEYKCTECDKTFPCPANLASHRRWHMPNAKGKGRSASSSASVSTVSRESTPSEQSKVDISLPGSLFGDDLFSKLSPMIKSI